MSCAQAHGGWGRMGAASGSVARSMRGRTRVLYARWRSVYCTFFFEKVHVQRVTNSNKFRDLPAIACEITRPYTVIPSTTNLAYSHYPVAISSLPTSPTSPLRLTLDYPKKNPSQGKLEKLPIHGQHRDLRAPALLYKRKHGC